MGKNCWVPHGCGESGPNRNPCCWRTHLTERNNSDKPFRFNECSTRCTSSSIMCFVNYVASRWSFICRSSRLQSHLHFLLPREGSVPSLPWSQRTLSGTNSWSAAMILKMGTICHFRSTTSWHNRTETQETVQHWGAKENSRRTRRTRTSRNSQSRLHACAQAKTNQTRRNTGPSRAPDMFHATSSRDPPLVWPERDARLVLLLHNITRDHGLQRLALGLSGMPAQESLDVRLQLLGQRCATNTPTKRRFDIRTSRRRENTTRCLHVCRARKPLECPAKHWSGAHGCENHAGSNWGVSHSVSLSPKETPRSENILRMGLRYPATKTNALPTMAVKDPSTHRLECQTCSAP